MPKNRNVGMIQEQSQVIGVSEVARNTYVLSFHSPRIARAVVAGQFVNISVTNDSDPLLRRPFSIYRTHGDQCEIIFNVVGKGTRFLQKKTKDDSVNVLGPLGTPYSLHGDEFSTAVLVGGGLGVAPLPISTLTLMKNRKKIVTILGARSAEYLVEQHLEEVHLCTDDGTRGLKGTAVDLLMKLWKTQEWKSPKIFACGPTAMLQALGKFAIENDIPCEVSLEGPMACGFGICQGCPVELADGLSRYALMCKDGPAFDVRRIKL